MSGQLRSTIEKGFEQLPLEIYMMGPLVPNSFLKFPRTLFTLHDFAKRKKMAKSFEVPAPRHFPYAICKNSSLKSLALPPLFCYKVCHNNEKDLCPNFSLLNLPLKKMFEIFCPGILPEKFAKGKQVFCGI